jgi:hypothetical protein
MTWSSHVGSVEPVGAVGTRGQRPVRKGGAARQPDGDNLGTRSWHALLGVLGPF